MKDRVCPEGLIFIHGKYWRAKAKEKLELEDEVYGLVLKVKRAIIFIDFIGKRIRNYADTHCG